MEKKIFTLSMLKLQIAGNYTMSIIIIKVYYSVVLISIDTFYSIIGVIFTNWMCMIQKNFWESYKSCKSFLKPFLFEIFT